MAIEGGTERHHALDALRAGALLLGVLGHATISFFPEPSWPADDNSTSPALLIFNFTQHIFRMTLFFTIAGFFAHLLLEKRGVKGFIGNRLKRIALPFLVFWPFVLAALVGVSFWAAGYADTGPFAAETGPFAAAPPDAATAGAPPPPRPQIWRVVPLTHLWFLYVLLVFYVGALALYAVSRLIDRKGWLGAALDWLVRVLAKSHLLPLVLAAPLAALFFLREPWTVSGGIRTPDFGFVPNAFALVGFGTAFGFGWLLHRQPDLLNLWRRWWPLYLFVAAALTVVCARIIGAATSDPTSLPSFVGARLVMAALYPLSIWAWCLALIGAATMLLSRENAVIRYLSDASYWIYIVHLPIVIALQVLVSIWPLGWQVKYPLILAIAFPILLASYQLLVRRTFIGGWLNGRRYGREPAIASAHA